MKTGQALQIDRRSVCDARGVRRRRRPAWGKRLADVLADTSYRASHNRTTKQTAKGRFRLQDGLLPIGSERLKRVRVRPIVNRNNFVNSKTMPVLADRDCTESD